jgi:hypothetical protein
MSPSVTQRNKISFRSSKSSVAESAQTWIPMAQEWWEIRMLVQLLLTIINSSRALSEEVMAWQEIWWELEALTQEPLQWATAWWWEVQVSAKALITLTEPMALISTHKLRWDQELLMAISASQMSFKIGCYTELGESSPWLRSE